MRPDELDAGRFAGVSKARILAEKPIPGMDGFRSGRVCGGDNLGVVEITVGGRGRTETDGFIGHHDVERATIGVRIDGNAADITLTESADDPDGDLSAISD